MGSIFFPPTPYSPKHEKCDASAKENIRYIQRFGSQIAWTKAPKSSPETDNAAERDAREEERMMAHEAHCHGVLMGKIGRLSLSYKFLHFDRIAGGMRPCRVRRGGITTVAGPEFQPEAIADGRCGMHDAIVANSPWSNDKEK